jgi:hypothetical protein
LLACSIRYKYRSHIQEPDLIINITFSLILQREQAEREQDWEREQREKREALEAAQRELVEVLNNESILLLRHEYYFARWPKESVEIQAINIQAISFAAVVLMQVCQADLIHSWNARN